MEMEKKSGKKKQLGKISFLFIFIFSNRRKQFRIGLFSLFLAAAGQLWQAMGILRARVKFLVSFINKKTDGPDEKIREPEIHQFENRNKSTGKMLRIYPFRNK